MLMEKTQMKKKRAVGSTIYLIFILILMYLPIGVVVLYSFNANTAHSSALFTGFSLQWYAELFGDKRGFLDALKTSLIVAGVSVVFSGVLGTLGALGMARRRVKKSFFQRLLSTGATLTENLMSLPIMLPEIILGLAFMSLFTLMNLPFGMLTLILAHITFCVPYVFIIVKGRLATMDDSLMEAARDLGASPVRAFFSVTLPLLSPAVLSGALLSLAMSLDDFVISFFVNGAQTTTLPLKIYSSVRYGVSAQVNALCTVMLAFVFALVALSQLVLKKGGRAKGKKIASPSLDKVKDL